MPRTTLPLLPALGLAVLAGLLIGLGFAPMGVWPATLVGVALLTWLVRGRRIGAAAAIGYAAGLSLNVLTIHWISVLGVGVAVALIGFMSLWYLLLGVLLCLVSRLRWWPLWSACVWVAVEFLCGRFPLGGFPWVRLALTAPDQPLAGYFAWVGSTGVSFLVVLVAALGLSALLHPRRWVLPVAAVAAISVLGALLTLVPHAQPEQQVTVGMVQGNVNRHEKGTGTYASSVTGNHLSETVFLMAGQRARGGQPLDFVVWPENATDIDPISDAGTRGQVEAAVAVAGVPILVGAVMDGPRPDTRQTSGLWWHPGSGPGDIYSKRNLVPFGEWIPFREFLLPRLPVLKQIGRQSVPGTTPGVLDAPTKAYRHLRVGDVICFELAWDETVYDTVRHGADVLISQSNTNTYAGSFEVAQQMVLNRVRALELGREVVASTLNSTSALVDADGRVHGTTAEFTAASRTFTVPLRTNVNLAAVLNPWLGYLLSLTALGAVAYAVIVRGPRMLDGHRFPGTRRREPSTTSS